MSSWLRSLSRSILPTTASHRRRSGQRRSVGLSLEALEDRLTPSTLAPPPPTLSISGAASVKQEAVYTLHLTSKDSSPYTIQSWSINWGDGSTPQTLAGNPSSVTHVYAKADQTFTISASASDQRDISYPSSDTVSVDVSPAVVIDFTSGSKVHLTGGDPDEYISYTQSGFLVTPDAAIDGTGAHFHLANGALYTHIHDDEPGGPGVVDLQRADGGSFLLDSLVVPRLDNTAGGGSLTFADSNGDSITVTQTGTYNLNWGPITSFSITPHNLLDSQDQRGYVDSIGVAAVSQQPSHPAPATPVPTLKISGAATAKQAANYTLNLSGKDTQPNTIQGWTINWGDGSAPQSVMGDPTSVTHVFATAGQTYTITASATDDLSNSFLAPQSVKVNVVPPVVIDFTSGTKVHLAGGDPDEYISYTQSGFLVTPDAAIDGTGAHFHLANGALYTHIHDDEPGGPGVVDLQRADGGSFYARQPGGSSAGQHGGRRVADLHRFQRRFHHRDPGGDLRPELGTDYFVHHHAA